MTPEKGVGGANFPRKGSVGKVGAGRGPLLARPVYSAAMSPPTALSRPRATPLALCLALALCLTLLLCPVGAAAQEGGELRIGLTFGGTAIFGLVIEHLEGRRGLELTVGTLSLRDVSVSAVAKTYLGPSAFRPVMGAGLWGTLGLRPRPDERAGAALIARFPVGADWRIGSGHYLVGEINVNRALWIRRADYSDIPPNPRPIPIPGFSYRISP
jgi:hypothetical protein